MITEAGLLSVLADPSQPDLSARQIGVLFVLRGETEQQGTQFKDVAGLMLVPNASITRACDVLVGLGYVKRWQGTTDRRTCYLAITAAGKRYLAALAGGRRAA